MLGTDPFFRLTIGFNVPVTVDAGLNMHRGGIGSCDSLSGEFGPSGQDNC